MRWVLKMGLLEKALKFKQEINEKGQDTLIDKIKGPAETPLELDEVSQEEDIIEEIEPIILDDNVTSETLTPVVELTEEVEEPPSVQLTQETEEPLTINEDLDIDSFSGKESVVPTVEEDVDFSSTPVEEKIEDSISTDITSVNHEDNNFEEMYNDLLLKVDLEKELRNCHTKEKFIDTVLFLLMGQIGISSGLIFFNENETLHFQEARGLRIDNKDIVFAINNPIIEKMFQEQRVVDVDDFKETDEYLDFISVEAKLLIPLSSEKKELLGAIFVGEKISQEEYLDYDRNILDFFSEIGSEVLEKIIDIEKKDLKLKEKENFLTHYKKIEKLKSLISQEGNLKRASLDVLDYFDEIGVESFAIFIEESNFFIPIITEKEDFLSLKEDDLKIPANHNYINKLIVSEIPIHINLQEEIKEVNSFFNKKYLLKMKMLQIFPLIISGSIKGFISIFKIKENVDSNELSFKMMQLKDFIFYYLKSITKSDLKESKYIDNFDLTYQRIENEISRSKDLEIPLTLVLFSIKNYKRYYNFLGIKELKKMLKSFEEEILLRLSDGDFSVRFDKHKILMVLPGKNRKYAVPMANIIRNEIIKRFSQREVQLLITFLTAEMPEDGNDFHSLIDSLD